MTLDINSKTGDEADYGKFGSDSTHPSQGDTSHGQSVSKSIPSSFTVGIGCSGAEINGFNVPSPKDCNFQALHKPTNQPGPQKILLRGDSSKSNSEIAKTFPPRVISEQIPRLISLPQTDITKSVRTQIPEKIDPPINLEIGDKRHVSQTKTAAVIFQAKRKGQIKGAAKGPIKGPFSSKYVWTRPSQSKRALLNSNQAAKNPKETDRIKRKNMASSTSQPVKKIARKGKKKVEADVSFNPDGFYEVKVHYDHVSKLAVGYGFKEADVEEAIHADNAQRELAAREKNKQPMVNEEDDDLNLDRFELDPTDELSSEEDV